MRQIFFVAFALIAMGLVAAVDITNCSNMTFSTPGATYNIKANLACGFGVIASNIIVDCEGHSLTSSSISSANFVTIQNCGIFRYNLPGPGGALTINSMAGGLIKNTNLTWQGVSGNHGIGLAATNMNNTIIDRCRLSNPDNFAFASSFVVYSGDGNTYSNNVLSNDQDGFAFLDSNGKMINMTGSFSATVTPSSTTGTWTFENVSLPGLTMSSSGGVVIRRSSFGSSFTNMTSIIFDRSTVSTTIASSGAVQFINITTPAALTLVDTSTISSTSIMNFTSLSITRGGSMSFLGGWIDTMTVINSSGIQTFGLLNSLSVTGSYLSNFNGVSTNNTTLMLNSVTIEQSQDINILGYTGNAYSSNSFGPHCLFNPQHWETFRPFYMRVKNGSSGIIFDNMTILGNGAAPPTYGTNYQWIFYVYKGASEITLKNSLINSTLNLVYNENAPSALTLDQNGYGQTMYGTKNITGYVVGRETPLFYLGMAGTDYPYQQSTSNHSAAGAAVCSSVPIPVYELFNATDYAPLTWRRFTNGTLNVTIVSPANNAYLGQSYTFPMYYTIVAGLVNGSTSMVYGNCHVLLQKDGEMGYEVNSLIPCGTGNGELLGTDVTASNEGGGYTLTVIAFDNSGAAQDSRHISFAVNGSGPTPGPCTGSNCWPDPNECSAQHPENCWTPCVGPSCTNSSYLFYDACVSGTSQYGTNRSYIERYITCNFGRLIGNAEMGGIALAIMVLLFFTAFVMMQNTRLDGKLAVLIPVFIMVAVWMGWIMWIGLIILGVIIALGIIRLISR